MTSCETVAASSEELTAQVDQTLQLINHVAENTVAMAEYASEQSNAVEELQSVVDEVAKTSQQKALDGKEKGDFAIKQIQMIERR